MKGNKIFNIAIALLLVAGIAFGLTRKAYADHDIGVYELDENATNTAVAGDDWDLVYAGTSGDIASVFVADGDDFSGGVQVPAGLPTDDTSYFTTGGSKDINDISQWRHQTGDVAPDKDEILNAYAAAYIFDGDLILYFGLDRFANNGDAQVGFWFFESPHSLNPDGTFSGVHDIGDVLVLSHFTQGGAVDTIEVYEWVGPPDADNVVLIDTGVDCAVSSGDNVCASVNDLTEDAPWPYVAKSPVKGQSANDFAPSSFYEGGLNLSALGLDIGCGGSFLAETRSSQSLDAQLKDFALGNFSLCDMTVTKTGDTLSKVGDAADYTVTIQNTGGVPLYKDDISDTLLGSITVNGVNQVNPYVLSNTCGASLAPGASCTITLRRTVQAGDPDPLPNIVTAVYRGKVDLSGTAISRTDDHSVNLFQPSITFDKSVSDELSKIGDSVDYTLTLNNTSSADTPDLVCTITDSTLGISKSVTLASGGSDVTTKSYTFKVGDPDPYANTASVSCSPTGFPNVLTASDSESVNLFQPSITFDKSVSAELSKVGDSVDYTLTLNNTSSADTPDLICTITDTTLGIDKDVTLAAGGSDVTTKSYTFQAGDPDPYTNTASVSCSPTGFPNVLTASDSESVNLFQPAIAADKTGDALSKVGDDVNYTITLSNNSSADTPALDCTATDSLLGVVFSGALPLGDTVIQKTRTVQQGDSDPLVNTVSVSCGVEGFPNVLTAGASHTTNLFQPAVEVLKSGPDTAAVGQTITYSFTINNLSSSDSPDLILASIIDTVIGDITAQAPASCSPLAAGASCSFTADYTIQAGDPNPLVNVVTVLYHPEGFPNDITDSDSHSLTIPSQGCTPGFWQGGVGAEMWDEVNDPDWTGEGTNPFIHTTLFNDFFNQTTDSRLAGMSMFDLVSGGGGPDAALKAARDMVAAYLNESAFPAGYAATSLADLVNMWYSAVAGGDSALTAFHNLVSGWNAETATQICPLP